MWLPLLLVGAAAIGGYYYLTSYKKDEGAGGAGTGPAPGTPEVPTPPPGVINISASNVSEFVPAGQSAPQELVWVKVFALNAERPDRTYTVLDSFPSLELATKYYEAYKLFFNDYNSWWTCPHGGVWMEMWGFGPGDVVPRRFNSDNYLCDDSKAINSAGEQTPTPPVAVGEVASKPLYIVMMTITGSIEDQQMFTFRSDAEAELYYRLLKAFFDQDIIRQAYTAPVGTIVLLKYGTKPSVSRAAVYDHEGLIGVQP